MAIFSILKTSFAALLLAILFGCASRPSGTGTFSFAVIGDMQYTPIEDAAFPKLIDALNNEKLAFVVHVGDFKAGSNSPCTDELFTKRFEEFKRFQHALIFTPGDNDWVDCRRPTNGAMKPLERLEKLRNIFFSTNQSLGQQAIPLTRQSDAFVGNPVLSRYRENAMWVNGGVVFITLNIQGSNDNVGFDPENDAEQLERTRANIEWLKTAMNRARATDIVGLAVFLQANPGFEATIAEVGKSAYVPFLSTFEDEAAKFTKPILFAHGDTHTFRVDAPYISPVNKRKVANVTRVETDGSPRVDWTRITVDPKNKTAPFFIERGRFTAN